LDIVAALQAKKALGEVCIVSEKPNYLFLDFSIMANKMFSFDALHDLLVILPYLRSLDYYSLGLCHALLLP